ncbi:MAG: (2Fe-2S) ferredoxin domain-containing protein [Sedimentisphaerales bacterium]|jgi:(2Fe-2S) ferredoxin|nr:(2Fe-2S) ferredoxin domain-containing protein [Sedimentisphaerales bacterium]
MVTPLDLIRKKRAEAVSRIIGKGYLAAKRVYVGMATCEIAAGSKEVMEVFKQAIAKGIVKDVYLSQKGCAGRCNLEPTVEVIETGKMPVRYGRIDADKARQIIEKHLKGGQVIEEWVIG